MLGILLTILKIIGIILLVLIGLILTVVAVILLVPIRYRGEGARKEKVLSGSVKITWLLHMLSIDVSYSAGSSGGMLFSVRLFGKTIYPKTEKTPKEKKEKTAKSQLKKNETPKLQPEENESVVLEPKRLEEQEEQPKKTEEQTEKQSEKSSQIKADSEKTSDSIQQEVETVYEPQAPLPALPESQKEADSDTKQDESKEPQESQKTQKTKKSKPRRDPVVFIKSKFEAIKKKLLAIKDKFLATKANLQKIKNKIEYWKNLLTSEPMKDAIATLWKRTKGLLRHILPRKLTGRVHFGFDDPSMTGKVLAYLSMLYPFTKDNLVIESEFETEELILEGNLVFCGRIRLGYLVYVALSVVLNKNIRRQYKRLRQGGKEDGKGRN